MNPSSKQVFLSSTFRDLVAERNAIRSIVERAGDKCVAMDHLGSDSREARERYLSLVSESDVMVLVLGFEYGTVPKDSQHSHTHSEYIEAVSSGVPVLAYLKQEIPGTELADDLQRFRDEVATKRCVWRFEDPQTLAAWVGTDLGSFFRADLISVGADAFSPRLELHLAVRRAARDGDLAKAFALNRDILRKYPNSSRAHFNEACLYGRRAMQMKAYTDSDLNRARESLRTAIDHGFYNFLFGYGDRSNPLNATPAERIIHDADLELVFKKFRYLEHEVRSGFIPPQHGGSSSC